MGLVDTIFDRTVTGLSKAMDLSWRRNNALAANVANAETPQYRAVDLTFGKELDRAFGSAQESVMRTDGRHLDVGQNQSSRLIQDNSSMTKPDGNNVDVDLQMGRLSDNSGDYTMAARLIRRQIGLLRTAIREGR
jgi:flagellar basal-body rod protein FlgB